MQIYFYFFLVSGFCSILYELIWLRLAMAQFGVTTAMVSIVLSVFMIGLGAGSWVSGYLTRKYGGRMMFPALRLYALTELLIGISAPLVPYELLVGKWLLLQFASRTAVSSSEHYLLAGTWMVVTLVPWCACMGATFPFAMLAIRNAFAQKSDHSFSYLYLANVLGAVAGALIPLLLIESLGFHRTLMVGASLNFLLAASALAVSLRPSGEVEKEGSSGQERLIPHAAAPADWTGLLLLFGTGITSMGVEVIWIRLYTPSLGTLVYAFAAILALYLAATYLGSLWYRRHRVRSSTSRVFWEALGFSILFAFLTVDPRLPIPALLRLMLGVVPLSGIVGFVTPMIVDRYASGNPDLAGRAYAINIVGCIIGPLLSGFVLLPLVGEKLALCIFAVPWLVAGLTHSSQRPTRRSFVTRYAVYSVFSLSSIAVALFAKGFEQQFFPRKVLRDSTATVIATGSGMEKALVINGKGITVLTPITKMMAHLPLAFLPHPPANALIICFGMGTSFRSALSWHIPSTAVELVPSVPRLFTFYHPTGTIGADSGRIVTDDGRSFLERTHDQYDVIVIDPPPPVGAAASSLLYSKEFYAIAKQHLRAGGILQQWLPHGDAMTRASVARALADSFPYVRIFGSIEKFGYHFLASMTPIESLSAEQLAQRVPPDAARDLLEWGPESTVEDELQDVLSLEMPVAQMIQESPQAPALQDDRPINEYFLMRWIARTGSLEALPHRLLDDSSRQVSSRK